MAEYLVSGKAATNRDWTDLERAAVLQEVHQILGHPSFKSSKQCAALLRSLVDHTLAGDPNGIKERTLGIEVFGRTPDYDTNADPVVRRTANEIRKRLAQYYQENETRHPVKMNLIRGSYLPEFEFLDDHPPDNPKPHRGDVSLEPLKPATSRAAYPENASSKIETKWLIWVGVGLLAAIACFLIVRFYAFRSPEYTLWKPLLDSGDQITLCQSDVTPLNGTYGSVSPQTLNSLTESSDSIPALISHGPPQDTSFTDANVANKVSTLLYGFKKQTTLRASSTLTYADLRQRPVVLIGGTNNPWSLIFLSKLRYSIQVDPATQDKWIRDAQNPTSRAWKLDGKSQHSQISADYAVVTRFFDKETGQWIMAINGLEAHGTDAAGELVADPAFAASIPSNVRSEGNFQIVLKTSVVGDNTGPFEVLAVYMW